MCKTDGSIRFADRAGWILVGGLSRRMGTDKALLAPAGAIRVAAAISPVCGTVILVGDPAKYSSLGLPVIPDAFPGIGPIAGIEAALRSTSVDNNLIVACDMPALDAAILDALFEAGGDCSLPQYPNGKIEPLCAVYHRRCAQAVRTALENGLRRVTDLPQVLASQGFELRYLQVSSPAPFANLNTPEDVARYPNG
ncbi:MAG: molybdenum cofactor guanylyltransferase [Terriglobia bacterium]